MVVNYFGIEVTRRCNLRCPHCFTESGGKAHPGPDTEALSNLLAQLAKYGAKTVAFSGGEPLLRRDLEQTMRHGLKHGIEMYTLVTNGFYATPERVASLKQAGLQAVQISIDGVDARDHCAVRACSPVDFYRALRAIRTFQQAGIVVDVATIICPTNARRAAEMLLLCEALRVRILRYCSFVPTGRAGTDDALADRFAVQPEQLDAFLELLRNVKDDPDAPVRVLIDHGIGPWSESGEFRCSSGEEVAYISSEGDVYPCPGAIFEPFKVGNVFESSAAEVLASAKLGAVRQIKRSELAEPCQSCHNDNCTGGCRGAAYAVCGSVLGAPSYCNVLRRMR